MTSGLILPGQMSVERPVMTRRRRRLVPPSHLPDHVCRAEAAELLGYPSIFRVRALEREGRLTAARGPMGSAWYPRRQVLALRERETTGGRSDGGAPALAPGRRRTDAELIAYLRGAGGSDHAGRAPTVADLVADTGVSIARAQKVYRFWLKHDLHPRAQQARGGRPGPEPSSPPADAAATAPAPPVERRSAARLERAALIRQLRAADPAARAAAFAALKNI